MGDRAFFCLTQPHIIRALVSLVVLLLVETTGVNAASVSDAPICRSEGKRFALLIGNQDYKGALTPLENPHRDTEAFSKLLCSNGFTVYRYSDLDIAGFDKALSQFVEATRGARTTLVYYSGHGFAAGGRNWLVPVDAGIDCSNLGNAENADTNFLQRRLVDLSGGVLRPLEGSGDQIAILDACRTDPIRSCYRGGSSPTLVKGFDRVSTSNGRLVVYATQNGQPARDSVKGSDTSPLMTAIVRRLPSNPQRDWLSAMGDVSREVAALTHQEQVPNLDISIPPQGCLAESCEASQLGTSPSIAAPEEGFLAFIAQLNDRALLEQLKTNAKPEARAAAEQRLAKLDALSASPIPDLPKDSPFEEFFEDFFKNRNRQGTATPPPTQSPGPQNSKSSADAGPLIPPVNGPSPAGGLPKTAVGAIDASPPLGETNHGWLGVRIQPVTNEIAKSLKIEPARGILIAGVDDKGPAKPAGIEAGDVVVKFDGKEVKEPKDFVRFVADSAVGSNVEVIVIHNGKEETKSVRIGRLMDGGQSLETSAKSTSSDANSIGVKPKLLGLDLAILDKDARARFKIKNSVKGVVVTKVDAPSDAANKRLSPGDVIVEVAQQAVMNEADVKKQVEQLKKEGKRSVLLLVSNQDGELRFVALSLD